MDDEQRLKTLEFLSKMAMTKVDLLLEFGSSYRFGKKEDGMLAADGEYWLIQFDKYRVNRKTGKCADHDEGTIDDLLIDWLLASLEDKYIEKHMPLPLYPNEEVPSYWHKDGWQKTKNTVTKRSTRKQIVRNLP